MHVCSSSFLLVEDFGFAWYQFNYRINAIQIVHMTENPCQFHQVYGRENVGIGFFVGP